MKLLYLNIESLCTIKSYFSKVLNHYSIKFEDRLLVQDGDMPISSDLMRKLLVKQHMDPLPERFTTSIFPDKSTIKNINLLICYFKLLYRL